MTNAKRPAPCTWVARVVAAAVMIAAAGCATERTPTGEKTPPISAPPTPAAAHLGIDLDGHPLDIFRSGVAPATVLLFVRTDCPISNRFAPEINRLYSLYHRQGAEFFLVYVDPDEQPAAIREHLRTYGYPCPAVRDPSHALVELSGATITPEAAVFDRRRALTYRGRINDLYADLGKARPAATTHDLADAIQATLGGTPVAIARTRAVGCTIADLKR